MSLLNEKVVRSLINKKLTISIAESCTGGLLSNSFTSINGASKIFSLGLVTYSNQSKIDMLKIPKEIVKKKGAVSKQVCFYMVKNLNKISKSDISISVTGIAGPKGGSRKKPVGLVFIGIKKGNNIKIKKYMFKNKSRKDIQKNAVNKCLNLTLEIIK